MKRPGIITFILLLLILSMPVCVFGEDNASDSILTATTKTETAVEERSNLWNTSTDTPAKASTPEGEIKEKESETVFKPAAGIACGALLVIGLLAVLFIKLRNNDDDNQDDDYDDMKEGMDRSASKTVKEPRRPPVGANGPGRSNEPGRSNGSGISNGSGRSNGHVRRDGTMAPEDRRFPGTDQPNQTVIQECAPDDSYIRRDPAVQGRPDQVRLQIEEIMGSFYGRGIVFTFEKELVIGSDTRCDIVFADNGVSPRHARIYRLNGRLYIEDLGSDTGTYLDGMRLFSSNPLRDGDAIGIGEAGFVVRL